MHCYGRCQSTQSLQWVVTSVPLCVPSLSISVNMLTLADVRIHPNTCKIMVVCVFQSISIVVKTHKFLNQHMWWIFIAPVLTSPQQPDEGWYLKNNCFLPGNPQHKLRTQTVFVFYRLYQFSSACFYSNVKMLTFSSVILHHVWSICQRLQIIIHPQSSIMSEGPCMENNWFYVKLSYQNPNTNARGRNCHES